jgi:hypothetical protein
MPHLPDHEIHDPELIAAYAAGDATGPALDTAAALVATCPGCAELHRDLRAIAAALPAMPAPVRRRDFRLSAGTAASLRPTGWGGFVALLAGPRFSLAAPLGAGLATLGLAGLLLGSGGLPLAGSASQAQAPAVDTAASAAGGAGAASQPSPVAVTGPAGAPVAGAAAVDGEPSERPVALVPEAASSVAPGPSSDGRFSVDGAPVPAPVPTATARDDTTVALVPAQASPPGDQVPKSAAQPVAPAGQDAWPQALGIVLIVAGASLIGLRAASRRLA